MYKPNDLNRRLILHAFKIVLAINDATPIGVNRTTANTCSIYTYLKPQKKQYNGR
jgi:hypothetical protein